MAIELGDTKLDLSRLLPARADNDYRGHPVALWVFVPITLITLGRSLIHLLRADGGAQSIATIPLDSFSSEGAAAVVRVFALWGLSQLLLGCVYVAVLWRYRALLPLMYLLLCVEYLARLALGAWKPVVTLETPPGAYANYILSGVGLVMLAVALRSRGERAPTEHHGHAVSR